MLRARHHFVPPPTLVAARLELRPLLEMASTDWLRYFKYFRDREIAELNGSKPIRMPLWLFRHVVSGEERGGDRLGFAVYLRGQTVRHQEFIGSVELYDLKPSRPNNPREATLGALIGEKQFWGAGLGSEACARLLQYAFTELNLERMRLTTLAHNMRARRAFEKIGFNMEYLSPSQSHDGQDAHYIILRETWLEQHPEAC